MRQIWMTGAAIVVGFSTVAQAAITVRSYYRMGENDSPIAVIGSDASTTATDGSGNAIDLNRSDTNPGVYASASPMYYPGITSPSTVATHFNANASPPEGNWRFGTVATTATNNVGFEMWLKTDSLPANNSYPYSAFSLPFTNGDMFSNGFGLATWYYGEVAFWYGGLGGSGTLTGYFMPTNQWHHYAMVIDGGVTKLFVDGTLTFSAATPAGIQPAANYTAIGGGPGYYPHNGSIDEVRMFTFAPGAFSVSDLLVPEPAGLGLLIGVMCAIRRKR